MCAWPTRSTTSRSAHPTRLRRARSMVGCSDWEIEERPQGDQPYLMVDEANGGLWDTSNVGRGNWAIFYVRVEDVAATLEQAVALGATVAVPLVDNGQIYFAHLLDPLGHRFGIWQPKE